MTTRRQRAQQQKPRRRFIAPIAIGTTLVLLGGLAVFAEGYDAQEVLPLETNVWVARDAGQYARVNTDLAEIDTVRQVEEPSGVAQSGAQSVVFAQGFRQLWPVDASNPVDLDSGSASAESAEPVASDDFAKAWIKDNMPDAGAGTPGAISSPSACTRAKFKCHERPPRFNGTRRTFGFLQCYGTC